LHLQRKGLISGVGLLTCADTFVRADGAFIPFTESFDISRVTTTVKGVGEMGEVIYVDLQAPINSLIESM